MDYLPLLSNYKTDLLPAIQERDGLYGVILSALRNAHEAYPTTSPEGLVELTHSVFLQVAQRFLAETK